MTKFEAFEAAEAKFDDAAREVNFARAAMRRSKSKATIARFVAAQSAFEVALSDCVAARDAYESEVETKGVLSMTLAAVSNETQLSFL